MNQNLQVAFTLGLMTAEHVHGVTRKGNQLLTDKVFEILEQVATGEMTLLDTPEETMAGLPAPPSELAAKESDAINNVREQLAAEMAQLTRQAMRDHREVAAELLRIMT